MSTVSSVTFDEPIDHRASNSMKRGVVVAILTPEQTVAEPPPMRVADTDFRALRPRFSALVAVEAACRYGEAWLEALLSHLRANHEHFIESINGQGRCLSVLPSDSLYHARMGCQGLGMDAGTSHDFMRAKARHRIGKGQKFGRSGHGYMRVNPGCPRATVEGAIVRLKSALVGRSVEKDVAARWESTVPSRLTNSRGQRRSISRWS
ncbi:MAG: hypothetical protein B7Z02_15235 [Rhodobacterales bacterium 32-67-9]|nr:MAG: hypothetical protein B7Z02_15235 [Rhodobacterales bacterium 32-67-9]